MATQLPEGPKLTAMPPAAGMQGGPTMSSSLESSHPGHGMPQQSQPAGMATRPHERSLDDDRNPPFPRYHRRTANPAPLGLLSFATLWWLFGLLLVHTRNIQFVTGIVPLALALGSAMVLAGIAGFFMGNTWGTTFNVMYGMYWLSLALFWIPFFGVVALPPGQFGNSLGVYYSAWLLLSLFFTMTTLRTSLVVMSMFLVLDLVYLLLMVSAFSTRSSRGLEKSAGAFSLLVAALSAYAGLSAIMTREASPFGLPAFELSHKYD
ncbi:hypothetical protein OC834_005135 [Tilletia horrida]|uniref:Uncharacterized protein n=1 Tax=Tilletia horrida TaxID=155126 RepID=A0AAN6GH87_9BASI|nr:hypothetical protein OC834_005135 [Tilletia horrida]KAK0525826.1 hypothetical protein OC835_005481 [Tilletia horrida]KAK0537187.1 hypothetical protein OC842_001708 [Tilletia horrida]KAK0558543.1 hypothetical protein OC844_005079 [Tilletia horrida]